MNKGLTDTLEHWGSRHLLSNAKNVAALVRLPFGETVRDKIGHRDPAMKKSVVHFEYTVYPYANHHQQDLEYLY